MLENNFYVPEQLIQSQSKLVVIQSSGYVKDGLASLTTKSMSKNAYPQQHGRVPLCPRGIRRRNMSRVQMRLRKDF